MLAADAAIAQDAEQRYRVELIVLMHLEHSEQPRELQWLQDYSEALDFLAPPEQADGAEDGADEPPPTSGDEAAAPALEDALAADGESLLPELDPLAAVTHLPEPGEEMGEAWRRLRLSGPFRPLQFLAWEQPASAPFPLLRIHDEEVVLVQDPWAEARLELEQAAADPGSGIGTVEGGGDEAALPPPTRFYRLDGTARLTRSRFLHLALELEWREPVLGDAPTAIPSTAADAAAVLVATEPAPESFHVHRLAQRRQVRTGRMEYFDGPVLGVLARISRVQSVDTPGDDAAEAGSATAPAAEWTE